MTPAAKHKSTFAARFRRHAFGWRSQPAITRIKEAVSEIKKAAKIDPVLAGEGAVLFIERVSEAIEQVDSSSGSIGTPARRAGKGSGLRRQYQQVYIRKPSSWRTGALVTRER